MRRADVTALVLDSAMDVSRIDRQIAGYAAGEHHPVVIVVNKWDLAPPGLATKDFVKYLAKMLDGMAYAPVIFTSAIKNRNVGHIIDVAHSLHQQSQTRVTTGQLNKALEAAYALKRPRPKAGKVGKIYYGTQVGVAPPTFVLFVDDPAHVPRQLPALPREPLPRDAAVPRGAHPADLQAPHALALEEPARPQARGRVAARAARGRACRVRNG